MNYRAFIEETVNELGRLYEPPEGRALAVRLLQHYCTKSPYEHLTEPSTLISPDKFLLLKDAVKQLAMARPIQYVLGRQLFLGREFFIEEGVLIPRPETEELVLWACSHIKAGLTIVDEAPETGALTIVDAACGSGITGISLAASFPESIVYAFDISDKAIEVTKRNTHLFLPHNNLISFNYDLLSDAFEQLPFNRADIIVSNPPYVTESDKKKMHRNVLEHEPPEALFVPDSDPLIFYKALKRLSDHLLIPDGLLFMEINEQFEAEVVSLFNDNYYAEIETKRDLFDKPRMVKVQKRR